MSDPTPPPDNSRKKKWPPKYKCRCTECCCHAAVGGETDICGRCVWECLKTRPPTPPPSKRKLGD